MQDCHCYIAHVSCSMYKPHRYRCDCESCYTGWR